MAVSGASGPSRVVVPERRPESDRTQGSAPGTFGCSSPARRASDVQSKPSASANLEHLGYRELGSLHFAERANRDLARRDAARQGFLGKPSFALCLGSSWASFFSAPLDSVQTMAVVHYPS